MTPNIRDPPLHATHRQYSVYNYARPPVPLDLVRLGLEAVTPTVAISAPIVPETI